MLMKLTLLPFADPEMDQKGPPIGPPFVAQFNPETFSVDTQFKYSEEKGQGEQGAEQKFQSVEPKTFSFDLLLDGTGASEAPVDVTAAVKLFQLTTGFSGATHRPYFLVAMWGTFVISCVLERYTVKYEMFRPEGLPLRATISASFREHVANPLRKLVMNLMSPDVTHAHDVVGGEHLSLVTHRVYDDTRYVVPVAEANGLDTLRRIEPGRTLTLPPVV